MIDRRHHRGVHAPMTIPLSAPVLIPPLARTHPDTSPPTPRSPTACTHKASLTPMLCSLIEPFMHAPTLHYVRPGRMNLLRRSLTPSSLVPSCQSSESLAVQGRSRFCVPRPRSLRVVYLCVLVVWMRCGVSVIDWPQQQAAAAPAASSSSSDHHIQQMRQPDFSTYGPQPPRLRMWVPSL